MVDLQGWSQPPLFEHRAPIRIRFEALIDPVDETVVLVVESRNVLSGSLLSLCSTPPVPFSSVEERTREIGRVFTEELFRNTGPF